MNSTHTPGTWYISTLDHRTIGPVRILTADGGDVPQLQAVAHVSERTNETAANARLIASAPTMRELLIELQDILDNYSDFSDGSDSIANVPNAAMLARERVRALLEQIDGGSK